MQVSKTALVLTATAASPLFASPTLFTDRLSWEGFAGPQVIRESFESESTGDVPSPITFDSGLTAQIVGRPTLMSIEAETDPISVFGLVNSTLFGENYLRTGLGAEEGDYTVGFSMQQTTAFSFYISGWQPIIAAAGSMDVTLLNNGQLVTGFSIFSDSDRELLFFGIVDDMGFDEVRIQINELTLPGDFLRQDVIAFDDIAWSVPAPATLPFLALSGLATTRRRR